MKQTKPHFSFWLIVAAALVWNLIGCLNYLVQTDPDAVSRMPQVHQIVINGRPAWATGAFAVAVFGGAVGCILLLLRRRIALAWLGLSFLGVLVTGFFTVRVVGVDPSITLSLLVAGALLWYASIVRRIGWLA